MFKSLSKCFESKNSVFLLGVLLSVYAVFAAPAIPNQLRNLFENRIFRFIMIFVIAYFAGNRNPQIALISALAFLFIMNLITDNTMGETYYNYRFYENFQNEEAETENAETDEAPLEDAETDAEPTKDSEVEPEPDTNIDEDLDTVENEPTNEKPKKKKVMRLKCELEEEFADYNL